MKSDLTTKLLDPHHYERFRHVRKIAGAALVCFQIAPDGALEIGAGDFHVHPVLDQR
jgi:hypothetical protein